MTAPGYPFTADFRAGFTPQPDQGLLEELRASPESLKAKLRLHAQRDRYFLARGVLGYKDVNPYTHGPLCRALEDRSRQRRMYLMHRGSLKTTIATITDCVGDALEDPEETRILIVNETDQNAAGFLSEIKAHFENNEFLAELFPELIPHRFGGPGSRWSTDRACLPRKTAYKEWTWTAAGVGKAVTGLHFTKIKFDDLIGFEARESPATMRYAISYAKSAEPLLIDMDRGFIDFVGTRWAIYDLYREILAAYGEDMSYFAREDIEVVPELSEAVLREASFKFTLASEIIGTPQPIFPSKFSLKKLHRLSVIDPVLYFAQYKNNPIADGIKDFNAEKVRWFDFDSYGNVAWRDEAGMLQRWSREQLDVVMTVDPNSGQLASPDLPAIVVSAQSPLSQVFVFEEWARRVEPDAFVNQIYDMWARWNPRALGIEQAGQQSTLFYFKKVAKDRGVYINVVTLRPKNRNKAEFIRKTVQPILNTGRLFLRKGQLMLQHQLQFHPDLDNDDVLNALAYGGEEGMWRTPLTSRELHEENDAVKALLSRRSKITGYGR